MIIIYEQEWGGIAVIENEKKAIEYINDLSYDYSDDLEKKANRYIVDRYSDKKYVLKETIKRHT